MSTLTAPVQWKTRGRTFQAYRVKNGETIYHGALVGVHEGGADDGLLVEWTDTLATGSDTIRFAGIADVSDQASNSVVGDGVKEVAVDISGQVLQQVAVSGATGTAHVNDLVYATDGKTLTLTATTGKNPVGILLRQGPASGVGDVMLFTLAEFRAASATQFGT